MNNKQFIIKLFEDPSSIEYLEMENEYHDFDINISDIDEEIEYFKENDYMINAEKYRVTSDFRLDALEADGIIELYEGTFVVRGAVDVSSHKDETASACHVTYVANKIRDMTIVDYRDDTELYFIDKFKKLVGVREKNTNGKLVRTPIFRWSR